MVDRLKRMINVSRYKVWPAEVESALYKHPAIQEACVIGIPDERSGESARPWSSCVRRRRATSMPRM
jgi:fatty-acyl-CoA synthase